jgi:hypothetical protein
VNRVQPPISFSVRPQPTQSPVAPLTAHTFTHGLAIGRGEEAVTADGLGPAAARLKPQGCHGPDTYRFSRSSY